MDRGQWAARPGRESLSKRLGRVARQIRERDSHMCVYCGATGESSGSPLHLDHLVPRSLGGSDEPVNLVTACRPCNCARQSTALVAFCRPRGIDSRRIWAQARRALPQIVRAA
jgi:5-methylcytosine-specific restriction endonuclease McrA